MKPIVTLLTILALSVMTTSCKLQQAETEGTIVSGEITAVVEFDLQTRIIDGHMVFVGVGGEIDGVVNPNLDVQAGRNVRLRITNRDGIPHDLSISDLNIHVPLVSSRGVTTEVNFAARDDQVGIYSYYCTVSGHRQAGMEGKLIIIEP
jgi:nitrite reductase (NO-forming)